MTVRPDPRLVQVTETALLVWFGVPLAFLLPPIAAVLTAALDAPHLPVWGLLALVAFMGVFLGVATRLPALSRRAAAWIRRGADPGAWALRSVVMIGLPILGFEILATLLRGVVRLWGG